MKKLSILICFIFTLFLLNGCATIITGTSENVSIRSNVPESKIFINEDFVGTGSVVTKLPSSKDYRIKIKATGYNDYVTSINKDMSGWVVGNILLGGIIGLVIDFASGGAYVLDKTEVNAMLEKAE